MKNVPYRVRLMEGQIRTRRLYYYTWFLDYLPAKTDQTTQIQKEHFPTSYCSYEVQSKSFWTASENQVKN